MDNISFTQRLVGAIVLLSLAIIFVPLLLQRESDIPGSMRGTNVPTMPEQVQSIVFQLEEEQVFRSLNQQATEKPTVSIKQALQSDGRTFPDQAAALVDATPAQAAAAADTPGWMVQVASFSEEANAIKLRDQLRGKKFPTYIKERKDKDSSSFQVRVGPELSVKRAESLRDDIEKATGVKGLVVRHP